MTTEHKPHSTQRLAISNALVHAYAPSDTLYREAMHALDGLIEQLEAQRPWRLYKRMVELEEQLEAAREALRIIEAANGMSITALQQIAYNALTSNPASAAGNVPKSADALAAEESSPAISPETPCSVCGSYGHFTHNHDPASEPKEG